MTGRISVLAIAVLVGLAASPAAAGALHVAAKSGGVDTLTQLIDQGADIEAQDQTGETPLTIAALAGHKHAVELLIERGAEVNGRNRGGFTAVHAAAYGGHLDIVQLLVGRDAAINDQENKALKTALHLAAEDNYLDIASFLVANGAVLEATDLNGHTPTSKAVFKLNEEMVFLLRRRGAGCQPEVVMSVKYQLYCLRRCN